jgi:predicted CopG family antitoxin
MSTILRMEKLSDLVLEKEFDIYDPWKNVYLDDDIPYIFFLKPCYYRMRDNRFLAKNAFLEERYRSFVNKIWRSPNTDIAPFGIMYSIQIVILPRKKGNIKIWEHAFSKTTEEYDLENLDFDSKQEGQLIPERAPRYDLEGYTNWFISSPRSLNEFMEENLIGPYIDWEKHSFDEVFNQTVYTPKRKGNAILLERLQWETSGKWKNYAEVSEQKNLTNSFYYLNMYEYLALLDAHKSKDQTVPLYTWNQPPRLNIQYHDSVSAYPLGYPGEILFGKIPSVFSFIYDIPLWGFYDDFDVPGRFVLDGNYPRQLIFKIFLKLLTSDFEITKKGTKQPPEWYAVLQECLYKGHNIFVHGLYYGRERQYPGTFKLHIVRRVGNDNLLGQY